MADNEKNPPWARQEGETDKAFEAFAVYRDLGPARSIALAAKSLGKARVTLERWSTKNGWSDRVSAWDDESDRLSRERNLIERQEARRKMLDSHAKGGSELHAIGQQVLDQYKGKDGEQRIAGLTIADAARIMEIGSKMERLARGETTERVELREALAWVERFVDLALMYLPLESHEAFLAEVETKLGVGGIQG